MLGIFLNYMVTLSLFPGIESEIQSCLLGDWMPVILFTTFNLSDLLGKVGEKRTILANNHSFSDVSQPQLLLVWC